LEQYRYVVSAFRRTASRPAKAGHYVLIIEYVVSAFRRTASRPAKAGHYVLDD